VVSAEVPWRAAAHAGGQQTPVVDAEALWWVRRCRRGPGGAMGSTEVLWWVLCVLSKLKDEVQTKGTSKNVRAHLAASPVGREGERRGGWGAPRVL